MFEQLSKTVERLIGEASAAVMVGDEIDVMFDETRRLIAEEARLRQELGLPPGPCFHEYWAMTGDQRAHEDAKLLSEIERSADDSPDGPS